MKRIAHNSVRWLTTGASARAALGFITLGPLAGLCFLPGGLGCVHATSAQADAPMAKVSHPFPNAVLMRGCTQEDVPALELYFTRASYAGAGDPSAPFLRFEISSSPTEAFAPATLQLSPLGEKNRTPGRVVRAQYVPSSGAPVWLRGTVVLDELVPGDHLSGRYSVTTPDGQHFQDSFRLRFTPSNAVCG